MMGVHATVGATVGIPQALLYYKYFPLWETFLTGLGAEIVVSHSTTKRMINTGTAIAENELCLPVKVFYGHLSDLKDKVDALFVPRVISVEKQSYTCPKFLALPDLARASDSKLPPVLDPIFNSRLGTRDFYSALFDFGKNFTDKKTRVLKAWYSAVGAQRAFQGRMEKGATPVEAIGGILVPPAKGELRIGIAGHPYNVYDPYISLNLIKKLRDWGVDIVTTEMIPPRTLEREAERLPKRLFWSFEKEVVGSAFHWIRTRSVDGIVYVLSFACGPDSLIQVLLEAEAKKRDGMPLMALVIDEHSGEAGMITRIEAFIDMLRWRRMSS
jgi:predicted nucleotide-binding protein (sugar kinase/HSP70/actin superfamily)